jgi:hypothetical protein
MRTPEDTLKRYLAEMNKWERECADRDERCRSGELTYEESAQIGKDAYRSIFQSYCSPTSASPRGFFYDTPPDCDPEREVITATSTLSPGLVEVRTKQEYGARKDQIYRVALENGEWKLVDKRIVLHRGDTLETPL